MKSSESKRGRGLQPDDIFHFLALLLVIVVCVFPFYWMVTASFKQQPAILASTPQFLFHPTLENYVNLKIALPLATPALAVSAIFCFIFSWNELLYAVILTRTEAKTAPVVATSFMSGYELPWGQIMATGTMVALPVIIFSMIVSRQLVRGLTAGAIK